MKPLECLLGACSIGAWVFNSCRMPPDNYSWLIWNVWCTPGEEPAAQRGSHIERVCLVRISSFDHKACEEPFLGTCIGCNALGFRREFFRVANSLSIARQHFALKLLFPSLAIGHHQIGLGYPTFASFVVWHHSSSQNVASFLHLYEAIRSNFKFRNSKRSSKFNKLYWINQRTRFWLKTVELNFLTWGIGTWFSNSNSRWW